MANSLNEKFEDFASENFDAETVTEMKNAVNAGAAPAEGSHLPAAEGADVAVANVKAFEAEFHVQMGARHKDVLANFKAGKLEGSDLDKVEALAKEIAPQFA